MANGDDALIHLLHTAWSAVLTMFSGLVVWNWNKLSDRVDGKADRSEMNQLREDMSEWRVEQQEQHRENRQRLDAILTNVRGPRRG